jgi:hypothetical protein
MAPGETAGASSPRLPAPAGDVDVVAVILAAREALAQAVQKGNLTHDPPSDARLVWLSQVSPNDAFFDIAL